MQRVYDEVFPILARDNRDVTLRIGSWSNKQGIVKAYMTYSPAVDQAQESIDSVLSLMVTHDTVHFRADIARSSGEIISHIADTVVERTEANENRALLEIERLCHAASSEFTRNLRALPPDLFL